MFHSKKGPRISRIHKSLPEVYKALQKTQLSPPPPVFLPRGGDFSQDLGEGYNYSYLPYVLNLQRTFSATTYPHSVPRYHLRKSRRDAQNSHGRMGMAHFNKLARSARRVFRLATPDKDKRDIKHLLECPNYYTNRNTSTYTIRWKTHKIKNLQLSVESSAILRTRTSAIEQTIQCLPPNGGKHWKTLLTLHWYSFYEKLQKC